MCHSVHRVQEERSLSQHAPQVTRGISVQGEGGLCPGGSLSRRSLSRESLSRVISVKGESLSRRSLSGGLCQGAPPPLYGKEWVVRILLECILVIVL